MRHSPRLLVILSLAALFTGLPGSTAAQQGRIMLQGFPLLRQQHALTCESSAASMATRARVSERQIMDTMPRNPDPNLGFRGNPSGRQGTALVDYGVYAGPVHDALLRYGYRSDVLMYGGDGQIMSYINRGWPVITWVTYALQPAQPRLGWANGKPFFLVPHEHAILVVGYDDRSITANDPWTARRVTYDWGNFNRAWGYFDDMALAVEPCPAPLPVTGLAVTNLSATALIWSWRKAVNATRYQITVIMRGTQDQVLYRGVQRSTRFALANPAPSTAYEILVRSLSPCGGVSDPRQLGFQTPGHLPLPPPTATPLPTATQTPATEATLSVPPSTTPTPLLTPSIPVPTTTPAKP